SLRSKAIAGASAAVARSISTVTPVPRHLTTKGSRDASLNRGARISTRGRGAAINKGYVDASGSAPAGAEHERPRVGRERISDRPRVHAVSKSDRGAQDSEAGRDARPANQFWKDAPGQSRSG